MVAPIAEPSSPLNLAAKDMTETQIAVAQELIRKYSITDSAFAAAVLTNLALNVQALRMK